MKLFSILALPLIALAAPAFAEPKCEAAGATLPMWQAAKTFEDAGGVIQEMKVNDGCFEVYGETGGKKFEVFYDPLTGAELERIEK